MKQLFSALLLFTIYTSAAAQETNTELKEPPTTDTIPGLGIFKSVEVLPKAPYDWNKYLINNLRYPKDARESGIQGKVYVSFVIERDGSISNVYAEKGAEIGGGIPEEAIRVVKNMPKWIPGYQKGVPVRCYFTVPLNFRLNSDEEPVYMPDKVDTRAVPVFNYPTFIKQNLVYPKKALKQKAEGTVYVYCTILKNGTLVNPDIFYPEKAEPVSKELEAEALRLVKLMSPWIPAKRRDIAVNSYMLIPVEFNLPQ